MTIRMLLSALLLLVTAAIAQPGPNKKVMKDLNLTDAQKEQFEKLSFDTQKKQIELGAKLATLKLEMKRLMDAESIDKSAIEKKMNEIADQQVALRMNRLSGWMEKNKVLTADQQKIWRNALRRHVEMMENEARPAMMKRMMRMDRRMPGGPMHDAPMMDDEDGPMKERRIEKRTIKEKE